MSKLVIKDIKPEWAERQGNKMIRKPPIMFVPTETEYNNPEKTNVFSINLILDTSTTSEKENSEVVEEGEIKIGARIASCDSASSSCVPEMRRLT